MRWLPNLESDFMPECTRDSLATSNVGFGNAFDDRQYWAAALRFMVLELAAIGGTDYSTTMTTTLISDAQALVGRMDPNQLRIATLNILRNNAVAAGATVPTDLSEINEATGCCFQSASVNFEEIFLFLLCQLGHHAEYESPAV